MAPVLARTGTEHKRPARPPCRRKIDPEVSIRWVSPRCNIGGVGDSSHLIDLDHGVQVYSVCLSAGPEAVVVQNAVDLGVG